MDDLFCFIIFVIVLLVIYFGLMAIFLLISRALGVTDKSAKISYNTIWVFLIVLGIICCWLFWDEIQREMRRR